MNESKDGKNGLMLISDLYMDYKKLDVCKDMTEEQILEKVEKVYSKSVSAFYGSTSKTKDGKKIRFSFNDFLDGMSSNMQRSMNVPRKYSAKQINTVLEAPYNYKDDLLRMAMYFYLKSQEYKGIIDYKTSMLTYSNTVYPSNMVDDNFNIEEYYKNIKFVENYNIRTKFDLATKIAMREDVFFAYEVTDNSGKNYLWKKLPSQYCKIIGQDRFETYRVSFDMSYFDTYPQDLQKFPDEFKRKYNAIKKEGSNKESKKGLKTSSQNVLGNMNPLLEGKYVELDSNKAIAFKFDEGVDYVVPYYSAMFIDIIRLAELKDVEILSNVSDNYKLLHQLVPMNKDSGDEDDYLISGEDLKVYHDNLKASAPDGVGVATTPMAVTPITLKGNINSAEESISNNQLTKVLTQSGTSSLLFNGSSTSALGLNKNIQVDENLMFRMLRQLEKFMNKRLYYFNKETYKYHINMLDHTRFNTEAYMADLLKAGSAGFNTQFEVNAVLGRKQSDFINSGKLMSKLGIMEDMLPFKSSHVGDGSDNPNSGEVGGKLREDELTDDGQKSRDRDL